MIHWERLESTMIAPVFDVGRRNWGLAVLWTHDNQVQSWTGGQFSEGLFRLYWSGSDEPQSWVARIKDLHQRPLSHPINFEDMIVAYRWEGPLIQIAVGRTQFDSRPLALTPPAWFTQAEVQTVRANRYKLLGQDDD